MLQLLTLAAKFSNRLKPIFMWIGVKAARLLSTSVRMKRLVFIVSLFAHVSKIDACRMSWCEIERVIGELNTNLHLSSSEDNDLALPLYIHNNLWDLELKEGVDECEKIVNSSPSWLRYNKEAMLEDIKRVLTISKYSQAV